MKTGAAGVDGAAGAEGHLKSRMALVSGVVAAVFYYPLAVVDRGISIAKICIASQAVTEISHVANEVLYTLRHTATAATDVAVEAKEVVKYGLAFQAAARLTTMLTSSSKYIPFLIM